ncbi:MULTISPECIES: cytochrome c oxidase subunit II [unclassified Cryobacterium]|uniref:aa3-type cytochrome oxidase subunit II n=1 Tax=unclassified Cryobacterium TaxID=2649013 RepID=UPI001446F359
MRSKARLRWIAIPVAAAIALVVAGCTPQQLRGYMPGEPGITNHTDGITGLWVTSWIVLLLVGLAVWGLIIWSMVVYRRRKGQVGLPVQLRYNMPIEFFYTIVPFILIIGFFAFTAREQASIEQPIENPDVQIEVHGKQWSWDFNYLNEGPGGEGVYYQGIQAQQTDESPFIDYDALPTLVLPVGQTVEIILESRDVIHSFWVPDFLYKKDMIPGKSNHMYFIPEKEGTYMGKCAELCGEFHSLMLFQVEVVSADEYEDYIQSLADAGFTGTIGQDLDRNQNQPGRDAPAIRENE